jgi:putative Mn2+ efflux pump MntP
MDYPGSTLMNETYTIFWCILVFFLEENMILNISIGQLISTGLLLGLGLTADAAAVSMANGLEEPNMKRSKHILIAFMYGLFQGLMPLIGYLFGSTIYNNIPQIKQYNIIPIIALVILGFLGTKMIIDGIKDGKSEESNEIRKITFKLIFIQSIATSIDALSTGLTFANYNVFEALMVTFLISLVTFITCIISVIIGKKFGTKLGNKALIVGGIILIIIGLEIFITGIIG